MAFTAICAALLTAVASAGTNDIQRGERVMVLGDSITHLGYWTQYLQLFENLRHPDSGTRYHCFHANGYGADYYGFKSATRRAIRSRT